MSCQSGSPLEIEDLRCESLSDPLAIDNTCPNLSWRLASSENGTEQAAYQILAATEPGKLAEGKADIWDSGKIGSKQSPAVSYDGNELRSKSFVYWKVRVWDNKGKRSRWSDVACFGVGLLRQDDWKARYIGMEREEGKALSPVFRKTFRLDKKGKKILLHVNSLGYHEAYVNGEAVSDAVYGFAGKLFH